MRLQRGVQVAGVEPELARELARACHREWLPTLWVAERVRRPADEIAPLLASLADAGYLQRRRRTWDLGGDPDGAEQTDDGLEWFTSDATGGGLANASFLKPMSRARAEQLLAGVLDRARAYNADETKPLRITELAVFGSYARPEIAELGDLDLAVAYDERRPGSADTTARLAYARASGRRFSTFLDKLNWADREIPMLLRNRSGYISVHTEDPRAFSDHVRVVYRGDESRAEPETRPTVTPG